MKPTDFAEHLTSFFGEYLPGTRNLSGNTIMAYRDSFRLLLIFCRDSRNIPIEKLTIKMFDDKTVLKFLDWLQNERQCSIATRNQRPHGSMLCFLRMYDFLPCFPLSFKYV